MKYSDRLAKPLTPFDVLQERFPFREKERTGESYIVGVLTRRVQGGDYALSGSGQVNFSDIKSSKIEQATLQGSQFFLSNAADWESVVSSDKDGNQSFTDEMTLVCDDLWNSARFRLEMLQLWGQNSLGSVGRISGAPVANVITIEAAHLSPSILYNLEGATLTIRDDADLSVERAGTHVVTAVDPEAGTITVTDDGAAADGDVIFFSGELVAASATFKTAAGLHRWATNTGSIAGLDASTRVVWKPTTLSAGNAPLSFDLLLDAARILQARGHRGKMTAVISLGAWNDAMSDMSATVRRAASDKKYVLGAESIEFITGAGVLEIIGHPLQKNGFAHVFPVMTPNADGDYTEEAIENSPIRRIGAQELAFVGPDGTMSQAKKNSYFEKIQRTNLLALDVYSHQALFPVYPARLVAINNIVNS